MTFEELLLFMVRLAAGTGVFLVGVHLLTGNIEQLAARIRPVFFRLSLLQTMLIMIPTKTNTWT